VTKATVSSKGQIAIPKAIRERLNLKPGTELAIDVHGESLVMRRVVSEYPDWRTMRGMAAGRESLTKALMEERAADLASDELRVKTLGISAPNKSS
jgi:AbrB family looped-hinge helix DNA binding protein